MNEQIGMTKLPKVELGTGEVAVVARMFGRQLHIRRASVSIEVHDKAEILVNPRLTGRVPSREAKVLAFRVSLSDETPARIKLAIRITSKNLETRTLLGLQRNSCAQQGERKQSTPLHKHWSPQDDSRI